MNPKLEELKKTLDNLKAYDHMVDSLKYYKVNSEYIPKEVVAEALNSAIKLLDSIIIPTQMAIELEIITLTSEEDLS